MSGKYLYASKFLFAFNAIMFYNIYSGSVNNYCDLGLQTTAFSRDFFELECGEMVKEAIKTIAQNKKAWHDYFIEETFEAGIELTGTEVKSIRLGKTNLRDSYAFIKDSEVYISGMHISPYEQGNIYNQDPLRDRKLLLHRYEINKLIGYTQQKGLTLVPLQVYFKRGKVKIELAVARGKKIYDKRQDIAERSAKREIDRRMKEYNR